jgi:PTH1 family peptidyl-tRNA hydrolase
MSISLVVGLGNPGAEYAATRHNLGWIVVEALARKHGLAWRRESAFESELARWAHPSGRVVWLAKPLTFVNESGQAAAAIARFHRIEAPDAAAVYDDLTIDAGRTKLSVTGSAGGHNGVASLLQHLGDGFARYRIGIGPKQPPEMDLKDYVLSRFSNEQLTIIEQKLPTYLEGLELLLERGVDPAMNQINRRDS